MKKHVFIAVAILVSVISASAQKASISWLPKGKATTAYDYGIFVALGGKYSYRYITLKERKIQKLDKDFNVIAEKSLVPVYKGNKISGVGFGAFHPKGLMQTNSYPYLLASYYDKANQEYETIAYRINEDLSTEEPQIVYSYSYRGGFSSTKPVDVFQVSEDGSHICHINNLGGSSMAVVYDDKFNEIWRTFFDLSFINLSTIKLSNSGEYLIANSDSELVMITQKEYKTIPIPFEPGEHILEVKMELNSSANEAVFAGTYSNKGAKEEATGIFITKYDIAKDEINKPVYIPFTKETVDNLRPLPSKADSSEYTVPHILISNEGLINVNVQRGYYATTCVNDMDARASIRNCYAVYIGLEIITVGITPTLEKRFEEIIDNKIGFTMQNQLMDAAFQIEDKSVFIYLSDKIMKHSYNICTISKTGKIASNKMEYDENLNLSIWQFKALGIVNNRIYIQGTSAAQYKYGIINLE